MQPEPIDPDDEDLEAKRKARALSLEAFIEDTFGEAPQAPDDPNALPSVAWIKANFKTKSAAIRHLVSRGFPVKTIARHLQLKYQHVRNVSTQTLKRGPNEDWRYDPNKHLNKINPLPLNFEDDDGNEVN